MFWGLKTLIPLSSEKRNYFSFSNSHDTLIFSRKSRCIFLLILTPFLSHFILLLFALSQVFLPLLSHFSFNYPEEGRESTVTFQSTNS
jgi:hypothetical protein